MANGEKSKQPPPDDNQKPAEKQELDLYLARINQEFKEREVIEKAKSKGFPYIDLSKMPINPDVMHLLSRKEAETLRAMPFSQVGKKIKVAFVSPEQKDVQAKIAEWEDKDFEVVAHMTSEENIKRAQQLYYSSHYTEAADTGTTIEEERLGSFEEEVADIAAMKDRIEQNPAKEALGILHSGAIKSGATDIHIQPQETDSLIRFRIDGVLTEVLKISPDATAKIVKQIKYLSRLKLNVASVPQDGQYYFLVNKRKIDVRVSALPSEYGEAVVMRILDPQRGFLTFEEIGFQGKALEDVKTAMSLPHGLILVTGPTGSGKTTTLYSMLNILNTPDRKIVTLEDPIEYHLPGITQSQIDPESEYHFHTGLRSILRQDPDIIMIGEIRDSETAKTAAEASLTGHIVLSTLHTNSAIESITRLQNIGLPIFMVAPTIKIIVAQRLVRKLCDCAKTRELSATEKSELSTVLKDIKDAPKLPETLHSPIGCDKCSQTGYKGQTCIVEALIIDEHIEEMIQRKASNKEILKYAREKGMRTMKEDGVLKVLSGITSLSEVWRVTR